MRYIVFAILAVLVLLVIVRFLSGEDGWICDNGRWVKHGTPSEPAPQTQCR